jgi:hypothetical protein
MKRKEEEELNNSKELDIKMASDKVINIIRDKIVNNASSIRDEFRIKNFELNYIMRKLDLKKKIKAVVKNQATNDEIEMFMSYLD